MTTRQQPFDADYAQIFVHLFSVGQILCGQTHGVAGRLCQEVELVTQGRAQLLLRRPKPSEQIPTLFPDIAVNFPVQFHNRTYGTLYIAPDPMQPAYPALPLSIAHLLTQTCSWLLYTFELSTLMQRQNQQSNYQASGSLTTREREILLLICRGYNQEAITMALSIAPATVRKHRQHNYERLGVHNEYDALLVAYQAGLFSPIEELLG